MNAPQHSMPNRPAGGAVNPSDREPTASELQAVAQFVPCSLTATLANDAALAASCVVGELGRLVGDELLPAELSERLETLACTVRRCGAMADAMAKAHGGHYVRGDLGEWLSDSPRTLRAARLLAELARKREGSAT